MSQQTDIEAWESFHAGENPNTAEDRRWYSFAERVERNLGIEDLDGDSGRHGYSLDAAYEAFERGLTADEYAAQVKASPRFAPVAA